jgi:hypothetical protein
MESLPVVADPIRHVMMKAGSLHEFPKAADPPKNTAKSNHVEIT